MAGYPVHYPVHYRVQRADRFTRLQLAVRLLVFLALGTVGVSFGMVFWFGYSALPAFAAIRISGSDRRVCPAFCAGPTERWGVTASGGVRTLRAPVRYPPDRNASGHTGCVSVSRGAVARRRSVGVAARFTGKSTLDLPRLLERPMQCRHA